MTAQKWDSAPEMQIDPQGQYEAVLLLDTGEVRIQLFAGVAPFTVNNFIFLVVKDRRNKLLDRQLATVRISSLMSNGLKKST